MPEHQVQQGDCINSIGLQYGFFPNTLWNHPDNAELKSLLETGLALFQEHQKHAEHLAESVR